MSPALTKVPRVVAEWKSEQYGILRLIQVPSACWHYSKATDKFIVEVQTKDRMGQPKWDEQWTVEQSEDAEKYAFCQLIVKLAEEADKKVA